ncbi:transcriptional repressor [Candidatus Gracilibacteria bacterium]|nr:transcriptional repressor [Candidatus Gracilibacteria bacterium]
MNEFEQLVIASFATRGWRITSGVRNLVDILGEASSPLSVQELDVLLGKETRDLDATTIYRILDKFIEAGILHNLSGRFIRCKAPHEIKKQHHFLLCEKCGKAEEIFLDYQGSIEKQLAQEKNFVLREVEMYFWGTCGHCSR